MVEAKQKAKELVYNYWESLPQWANLQDAKDCAIIAVDEIIKSQTILSIYETQINQYWNEVKTEINKL